MRKFESGATRDNDETKLDFEGFLSPQVLRRYAEYMNENRTQADGNVRASDNWQKGIPRDAYMKSMWRHFFEVWEFHRYEMGQQANGRTAEFLRDDIGTTMKGKEALCALLFNVMGYLFELEQGR